MRGMLPYITYLEYRITLVVCVKAAYGLYTHKLSDPGISPRHSKYSYISYMYVSGMKLNQFP